MKPVQVVCERSRTLEAAKSLQRAFSGSFDNLAAISLDQAPQWPIR